MIVSALRDAGLDVDHVLGSPFILIGSVDDVVDEIYSRRERLGISYVVVFEKNMETFGPILSRLAGLPGQSSLASPNR